MIRFKHVVFTHELLPALIRVHIRITFGDVVLFLVTQLNISSLDLWVPACQGIWNIKVSLGNEDEQNKHKKSERGDGEEQKDHEQRR